MKNLIVIDIDTERDKIILIRKPPEINPPSNPEEAKEMIISDISCVNEALCSLIHIADQNNYAKKEELITTSIKTLTDMLKENKTIDNEHPSNKDLE